MYAQLYYAPPEASGLVEGVPPALDAVIARGMAKDPDDRFPTAGALAAAAREALQAKASTSPPMTELPAPAWTADADSHAAAGGRRPGPARPGRSPAARPRTGASGYRAAQGAPLHPNANGGRVPALTDWGGTRPPGNMPPGASPDPAGSGLLAGGTPGGSGRRPAWRRFGVPILAAAAAVAVADRARRQGFRHEARHYCRMTAASRPSSLGSGAQPRACPRSAGTISVGGTPNYVQVAPNGKFAYITNPGARAITVLNTANDRVSGTIKIPQGPPQSVSFSPDSRTAYVSVYREPLGARRRVHRYRYRHRDGHRAGGQHHPGPLDDQRRTGGTSTCRTTTRR